MIIEQLFPSKSPTMTEGTLVIWRIKPGDKIASGQVIALTPGQPWVELAETSERAIITAQPTF